MNLDSHLKVFSAFLLAVSLSSTAQAGGYGSWKDKLQYLQCLRTPAVHFDGTIAEAALATPDLSTLVFALGEAGLVDTFLGEGNFTVFAPTNEAFGKIPGPVLEAILADVDLLTTVLSYHVTLGHADPRRAYVPRAVNTLAGQNVFLGRSDGSPYINNSGVSCQSVRTSNGTVYVIDSVLLPQF